VEPRIVRFFIGCLAQRSIKDHNTPPALELSDEVLFPLGVNPLFRGAGEDCFRGLLFRG
jgi:hypothetical protein